VSSEQRADYRQTVEVNPLGAMTATEHPSISSATGAVTW
jgi:hypothetical protein